MKLSAIKVNADAIEHGAWVKNLPEMGDLELKVRGIGNAEYRRLYASLADAAPRSDRQDGRLTPEASERIATRCLLDTVLLDWRGLEDDAGPVAFSKETAEKLLTDPNFRLFRDAVAIAASRVAETREQAGEEAAKN